MDEQAQAQTQELTDEELKSLLSDPRFDDTVKSKLTGGERARLETMGGMTGSGPKLPLAPTGGKPDMVFDKDMFKTAMGGIGKLGEIGAGFLPGGVLPRTIGSMGTGAISGLLNEEDPESRAAYNGALELGGSALSKLMPAGGLILGQLLGGKTKNITEDAGAFLRERKRSLPIPAKMGGAPPLGDQKTVAKRMARTGDKLEEMERASPSQYDLKDLVGATDDVASKQIVSSKPVTRGKFVNRNNRQFLREQVGARNPGFDSNRPVSSKTVFEPSGKATSSSTEVGPFTGNASKEGADLRDTIDMQPVTRRTVGPKPKPNTKLTTREAGELKRGQQAEGAKVTEAKANKETRASVTTKQDLAGQASEARAKDIRRQMEEKDPQLTPINARLADLNRMRSTNNTLRGKGTLLGNIAGTGMRGGLGAGVGGGLAYLGGGDIGAGAKVGGLLGVGASPSNVSRLGFAAGRFGDAMPTAMRSTDSITDLLYKLGYIDDPDVSTFTEKPDKPNVQRRKVKK